LNHDHGKEVNDKRRERAIATLKAKKAKGAADAAAAKMIETESSSSLQVATA
jgi:hypothetical protein